MSYLRAANNINNETVNQLGCLLSVMQGMFGGAIFALGNNTSAKLAGVTISNNTAAAGGAAASLGGSSITCSKGCSFRFNKAKVRDQLPGYSQSSCWLAHQQL